MKDVDFKAHPFWTSIESLKEKLDSFTDVAKSDARFNDTSEKTEYLFWIVDSSSSSYFSEAELTKLVQEVNSISQHVDESYANQPSIEAWFAAIFTRLPYPRIKKIFRSEANDAIESFTTEIARLQFDLREKEEAAFV